MTLNTAVVAPIPSTSETNAVSVSPGLLTSCLMECLRSSSSQLLTSMCCRRCESQRLHHRVVHIPPHLLNLLILACRVHAICQKDHKQLLVGIDPDGSSREARVSETML